MDPWIIYDGTLQPAGKPVALATSRGLMYGEGVFETLRLYQGRSLLFKNHMNRLKRSMDTLGMEIKAVPGEQEFAILISRLLRKNELLEQDAIVRLQFWRDGGRGYQPPSRSEIHYTVSASPCPVYKGRYPALATVSTRRIPSESLPADGKFTNAINYMLAAGEAAGRGADDALMQTVDGGVSETTVANIFWISGKDIFTPAVHCDLLPGITRRAIINIINGDRGLEIRRGNYPLEVVYEAEAAFLCNSVREILPVQKIDDRVFDTGHPVLDKLQRLYSDFRNQNLKSLPVPE